MFLGKKRYWLFQFAGWGLLFLFYVFFAWFYDQLSNPADAERFLVRGTAFLVISITITHAMRASIIYMDLLRKQLSIQIILLIIISIVVSLICGMIELYVFKAFNVLTPKEIEHAARRGKWLVSISNMLSWLIYIFGWNAFYLMYHYIRDFQRQQIDTLQLKSLVKELELKTIKSHINPHFIFNALNSIRALVDENPERARDAITELSNILRNSITLNKTEAVTLQYELDIVADYMALEKVRFEDRLHVVYKVEEHTLDKMVPPMMLQMMVENAIKHGISKETKGGTIAISSHIINNFLELSVENTGTLIQDPAHEGFGLNNIIERLRILYAGNAHFSISQFSDSIVRAVVQIPVNL